MKEIWKDIIGLEGLYQVSNFGRVKSIDRLILSKNGVTKKLNGRLLKPQKYLNGYLFVTLGSYKSESIHRLVAQTFLNNCKTKVVVNHIDGNKTNNHVDNLEWTTDLNNQIHAIKNNLIKSSVLENEVIAIRNDKKNSNSYLAKKYGIDRSTVSRIRNRKIYKFIP